MSYFEITCEECESKIMQMPSCSPEKAVLCLTLCGWTSLSKEGREMVVCSSCLKKHILTME